MEPRRGQAPALDPSASDRAAVTLSPRVRSVLYAAAIAIAVAPILVGALGLVPTYRDQGRFLIYYAPFICFISMAYVLYVRDSLARTMFAHLLRPALVTGEERRFSRARVRRLLINTRRLGLMLLPLLLFLGSIACIAEYTSVFAASLHEAADGGRPLFALSHDRVGSVRPLLTTPHSATRPSPALLIVPDTAADRHHLLETTPIEQIPYFTALSCLYIGAFLGPLLAVLLMGVREYAKDALELTERDIVLGRILLDSE